jgi:uncharacterized protein
MILCDTGVLLSLVDRSQPGYKTYSQWLIQFKAEVPLLTTLACFTEAMYLAYRSGGYPAQKQLAALLQRGILQVYQIQVGDYDRLFALMEKYRDRPMDFADATLVLAAERTKERRILTIDSDFLFYRIGDDESFTVIGGE